MDPELDAWRPARPIWPWLVGVSAIAAVAAGVGMWAWPKGPAMETAPESKARASASARRSIAEDIRSLDPDVRSAVVAAALSEELAGRVPAPLVRALERVSEVMPPQRELPLMEAVADAQVMPLWRAVCPQGATILSELMREGRADATAQIYRRCDLGKVGLVNIGLVEDAGGIEVLLAHAIYAHLKAEGTLTRSDQELLLMLAQSRLADDSTRPALDAPRVLSDLPPPPEE